MEDLAKIIKYYDLLFLYKEQRENIEESIYSILRELKEKPENRVVTDAGVFTKTSLLPVELGILYSAPYDIKKGWFFPKRYWGIRFVLEGTENEVGTIDNKIVPTAHQIYSSKTVYNAFWAFQTERYKKMATLTEFMESLVQTADASKFRKAKLSVKSERVDRNYEPLMYRCVGDIFGLIKPVLEVRDLLLNQFKGVTVYEKKIVFLGDGM